MKYGQYLYKNLIIFAPSVEDFGGNINIEAITQFVDDGGNLLVAGSPDSGSGILGLALECGFEIDEENAVVIDHLNYDLASDNDHTKIVVSPDNLIKAKYITDKKLNPFLYYGTGILVDKSNPLTLQILTASKTAYSYNPANTIVDYPHVIGKSTTLIAALQARNNARIGFSGSLYFFSDQAFTSGVQTANPQSKYDISGNRDLSLDFTKWIFGETGHIRVSSMTHHPENDKVTPSFYTVMDPAVFNIQVEILDSNTWVPYVANDIQMEFVRIDPFVRKTMKMLKPGVYQTKFKIPDIYGVYQFKVKYEKVGLSYLNNITQISVRPLKHTQYERFIASAYPYYVSAFSMMAGTFIMSFFVLHFKES